MATVSENKINGPVPVLTRTFPDTFVRVEYTNLRFGSVKRLWWMSNILCWVKYPKGQSSEEVTWRQQTSDWPKSETGCFCQKVGNVLELRNIVTWVATVFFKKGKDVIEFATSTLFVQDSQFVIDFPPCGNLSWSIWHSRDSLVMSKNQVNIRHVTGSDLPIGEGNISKLFSSSAVNFISESRMVRIEFRSVWQNLICESIKFSDMLLWV